MEITNRAKHPPRQPTPVPADLSDDAAAKLRCGGDYKDRLAFAKKQWQNLTHAGQFSSDRTIQDYAENIWGIEAVSLG